ncbi:hypothetical protein [Adhaeretor mobilis]|uniref:Uncharacterized protein n=1 Tax=Adhaeretor mobilis TaxID=1930276 RepID=A0A517MRS2_9BACT|nr:hypothetical protein [Adhaeretor mobilis]QDS97575.1 hypothetical protein HG15A2_08380 [Adhaeretor mobilis]
MKNPKTISDVLKILEEYHRARCATYQDLAKSCPDPRASILLDHLVELEEYSVKTIRYEVDNLVPEHATYLTYGATLSDGVTHATECRCHSEPAFQEVLDCTFTADQSLSELFDRLDGCSSAGTVVHLAERLRDMENIKQRQIAKYTRQD